MPILKSQGFVPGRKECGTILFPDAPEFYPNLSPKEVLHLGSFGGGYFRSVVPAVKAMEEFVFDFVCIFVF